VIADELAGSGAHVVITGRTRSVLDEAVSKLESHGIAALVIESDIVEPGAVQFMFDRIDAWCGRIDIMVNNAGTDDEAPIVDATEAGWERVLRVNLTVPFLVTQQAACRMTDGGVIVNMGFHRRLRGRRPVQ
jgi:NAD(P)-dependent dehydrogenase (short-subunit alcohol dehydrogenase family)